MPEHPRCGLGSQPHGPHKFRRYLHGLGAVIRTYCPGNLPDPRTPEAPV